MSSETIDWQDKAAAAFSYTVGGSLPADAPSYVIRPADAALLDGLRRGELCYLLDTRQVGKSSLLVQLLARLLDEGEDVAYLDLSAFGQNLTLEQWYFGLLDELASQAGYEREVSEAWERHGKLGPSRRWFTALRHGVLRHRERPLYLFVDEIDAIQSLPFSVAEWFAGIRALYQERHHDAVAARIVFCLAGAIAPSQLIRDTRVTPFNIGHRIELSDFRLEEARPLAQGLPVSSEEQRTRLLERVLYWTGGHPYLTQLLCQALAQRNAVTVAEVDRACAATFFTRQARESDANLTYVRDRLLGSDDVGGVLSLYRQTIGRQPVPFDPASPHAITVLLSGIVSVRNNRLEVRNRIYRRLFDPNWIRDNLPGQERRRQEQAARRGFVKATLLWAGVASVLLAMFGLSNAAYRANVRAEETAQRAKETEGENRRLAQETAQAQQELTSAQTARRNALDSLGRIQRAETQARESLRTVKAERNRVASRARAERVRTLRALRGAEARIAGETNRSRQYAQEISQNNGLVASGFALRRGNEGDALKYGIRAVRSAFDLRLPLNRDSYQGLADAVNTGLIRRFRLEHPYPLASVDYCMQDRAHFVVAGQDPRVLIYDADTGKLQQTLRVQSDGSSQRVVARYAPNGKWIAAATTRGKVFLWSVKDGKAVRQEPDDIFDCRPYEAIPQPGDAVPLAFFHDGRHLVTTPPRGSNAILRLWDIERRTYRDLPGKPSPLIRSVDVTAEQEGKKRTLIAVAHDNGMIQVLDATTGAILAKNNDLAEATLTFRRGEPRAYGALSVRFAFNTIVCTGRDFVSFSWGWESGNIYRYYQGHQDSIGTSDCDADLLVTAGNDRTVCVWNRTMSLRPLFQITTPTNSVSNVRFRGGGEFALAGEDGVCEVWRVTQPLAFNSGDEMVWAQFSADGKRTMWVGKDGVIWTGTVDGSFRQYLFPQDGRLPIPSTASFSSNGHKIATACDSGSIRLWDVGTNSFKDVVPHQKRPVSVAFTHDGKRLISADAGGTVWTGDAATGKQLSLWETKLPLRRVEPSPDGRLLALACADGTTRLWNVAEERFVAMLRPNDLEGAGAVLWARFSPDGRYVVTGGENRNAYLWDWRTSRLLATLIGHYGAVTCATFSPNGKTIATASKDGTVRLWSMREAIAKPSTIKTLSTSLTIRSHIGGVHTVDFFPDGENILTASADGTRREFPASPAAYLKRARKIQALLESPLSGTRKP